MTIRVKIICSECGKLRENCRVYFGTLKPFKIIVATCNKCWKLLEYDNFIK